MGGDNALWTDLSRPPSIGTDYDDEQIDVPMWVSSLAGYFVHQHYRDHF